MASLFNESVNLLNGILRGARDVGNETQYGSERLGEYDQWPWWDFRSNGFALFLRTNFLPCGALFLGIVINHEIKKERLINRSFFIIDDKSLRIVPIFQWLLLIDRYKEVLPHGSDPVNAS